MFRGLTDQLQASFAKLRGKDKLSEDNISEAVREVRLALLEADVSYSVVKTLIARIKEKALGRELLKYKEGGREISPREQFIKIVHDELVHLMGSEEVSFKLHGKPSVMMLCGLQGSGKTTQCIKLAKYLVRQKKAQRPLVAACDLQRPAAVQQLQALGATAGISVFVRQDTQDPLVVAKEALAYAKSVGHDLLILDTAGRLHIDEPLMEQLAAIKQCTEPQEIIFVANATTGQDAVHVAKEFNEKMAVTGTILTMLDGNARAGAALSIREVTGKPLLFEGIGEKVDDIQLFNPSSMADRILGMGDTINLVRKVEEHLDEKQAQDLEEKLKKASFTYMDYLKQIQMVRKMGSMKGLLSMLPGMSQMPQVDFDEKQIFKVEAIILSMTLSERLGLDELSHGRKRRVADGSGVEIEEVNRLVKSFKQAKQFFKNMPNMKMLEKMFGGA